MKRNQTIPVVSLKNFSNDSTERRRIINEIGAAFCDIGFVAIEDHDIDSNLIKKGYQVSEDFFLRDYEVKRKYEDPSQFEPRGFSSMGREHVRGLKTPDLKEFWHVGRENDESGIIQNKYPKNVWPQEGANFKSTMLELYDQLEECACHVLEAAALYLGLPQYTMCDMITDGNSVLRLAHYPPVPEECDPAVFRSAPHEDIDLVTLLCEATGEGLEILSKSGEWLPVHSYEGQIIVNVGDMLQNLTNGFYKSTTHRVSNNHKDRNRRLSMPYFVHPRAETDLTPLEICLQKTGGLERFRSLSAREYFNERLTEIGFGKNSNQRVNKI